MARIDGTGILISAFSFFSVPFCEFDSSLQPNFEKKKLLRFDGIDLSPRKSKIAKEFT